MTLRSRSLLLALLVAAPAAGLVALATPAAADARVEDVTITSFDNTPLAATLFVPGDADENNRVPFVLMTHGWAGSRVKTLDGRVADLVDAGYGVLTWDSRGFGASGGEVMLNHPAYEGKDVSVLIDWLARNTPVQMDGELDPRIGMSGGSYAGGIQLLAAAHDARIDVIAPEVTWNDLAQSLAPNNVVKAEWVTLLFGAGAAASCRDGHTASARPSGCQTSALARYYATVMALNEPTEEIVERLAVRSPATYMDAIDVPTLVIQGFPDTLFDVDQAIANYEGVKANGAPVKLWLHDGGHAYPQVPVPNTQAHLTGGVVLDWFNCHLQTGAASDCSEVGPEVEYYANGAWHSSTGLPLAQTARATSLNGIPPMAYGPTSMGNQGQWIINLEAGQAGLATLAVGSASVSFNALAGGTDAHLFASLGVRNAAGTVTRVDGQVAPVKIVRADAPVRYTLDLVDVAATVREGESLVLTLATFDMLYNNARGAGFLYLTGVDASWASRTVSVPPPPPPPPVPQCDGADLATSGVGLDIALAMGEAAYDPLDAISAGVSGVVVVERDGTRLQNSFVTISVTRDLWVGNVGRDTTITGRTNEHGALCFEVPLEFTLPGDYSVRAEVAGNNEHAAANADYAVGV